MSKVNNFLQKSLKDAEICRGGISPRWEAQEKLGATSCTKTYHGKGAF